MVSRKIQRPSVFLVGLVLLACLGTQIRVTSAFPTKWTPESALKAGQNQIDDLIDPKTNIRQGAETTTTEKEEKKGLSTMDYVWIGVGCLVGLLLLSCLISYLFCTCVKEIICLPIKCLKGVLCCCC